MVEIAVMVAQHLDLDMAGTLDHLFQIAVAIAEGGLGLAAALADLVGQFVRPKDRTHAAAAAAPRGFQHDRVADLVGHGADRVHVARLVRVGQDRAGRDHRHPGGDGDMPGAGLVAQHPHRVGPGPDEGDTSSLAGVHERRVFRQQAIAGVDRVGTAFMGDADDVVEVEIGRHRALAGANLIGLVSLETVQRELVLGGKDRDGALAEFVGGAQHPDGDLAPVGDEDFLELAHGAGSSRWAGGFHPAE